jgi:hypothetical protein
LGSDGSKESIAGIGKEGHEAISGRFEDQATVGKDRMAHDGVMLGEGLLHRGMGVLPKVGRTLYVCEQEGHGAGGQVSHG